jgi:hypothetical protein
MRHGYTNDPLLEETMAAYVAGDMTMDECRARLLPPIANAGS